MEAAKEKMEARQHKADVVENQSHGEEVLRDAVIDRLRERAANVLQNSCKREKRKLAFFSECSRV